MDIFAKIAEERIKEAMQRGEFDNLAGKGKPIELDEMAYVPPELRMGYKILRNAGVLPEELAVQQELITLRSLLDSCLDEDERRHKEKELREKTLKFNLLMEKRGINITVFGQYEQQIYNKLKKVGGVNI